MILKEIMSTTDTTFAADDTLSKVAALLVEKHHSCALICKDNKPVGIITERDIVRLFAYYSASGFPPNLTVKEVMTVNPISVSSEMNLTEALYLARSHHLRHLPVVDKNECLVGIVTQSDMVTAYLSLSQEYIKLEVLNQELHLLSLEDSLTGLPNRRAMEIDLRHSEAVSRRQSQCYAVALMDIDFFKVYNDHYGHPAGDEALRSVSEVMKKMIRDSDKLFRYGGEEFLYLMPSTSKAGAVIVCNRIRKAIYEAQIEHSESDLGYISISIGIAAKTAEPWHQLVEQADKALYQAKEQGRNKVLGYTGKP